ncbi:MAG: rhomboid family intramembrane serine protease [Capsulimonadaceae bacterium]|nr:rhomboid family intramembrane serine protease [Capsulimonadaceae bacterium]
MIPLYDNNPTRSFPLVTILIILINIGVFCWQNSGGAQHDAEVTGSYGFVPYNLSHNTNVTGYLAFNSDGEPQLLDHPRHKEGRSTVNEIPIGPSPDPVWITVLTAMFLHGSLVHIGFNMLFLWIFGNNVEDALGKGRYLVFYLICGIAAAFAQTLSAPDSYVPNIGASGAIAGIMGAYIVMWPNARVTTLISLGFFWLLREISAFWVLGIWILIQVVTAHYQMGGEATGGVAYFAHVGGFVTGLVGILLLGGTSLGRRQRRYAKRR